MYVIQGKVIEGQKRGKGLGFPTANMSLNQKIPEGIYISETIIDQDTHPSLTFIGAAITFGEELIQAETHILHFDKTLYDRTIEVRLIKKIRDNMKFTTEENLITQMEKDRQKALEYFKDYV